MEINIVDAVDDDNVWKWSLCSAYSTAQVVFQNPPRASGEWILVERIKF